MRSGGGGACTSSSSPASAQSPSNRAWRFEPSLAGDIRTYVINDDYSDFTDVRALGQSGTYGVLFAAEFKHDGTAVILKRYVNYQEADGINDDILKEVLLLQHLNAHPETKTVRLFGLAFGEGALYLVIEPLTCDLRHLMTTNLRLDSHQRRLLLFRMLGAFNAIHQLGIVHNDIKPANIMLLPSTSSTLSTPSDEYDVRVIDFGLADFVGIGPTRRMSRHYVCTEKYKAPDDRNTDVRCRSRDGSHGRPEWKYHDGNRKSFVSDVYSLAVTIINVCFRHDFDVQLHADGIYADGQLDGSMELPDRFGADGCDLLRKMLDPSTRTRITCAQALQHPYFRPLVQRDEQTVAPPLRMTLRGGGGTTSTPRNFGPFVHRHEKYTREDYVDAVHELAYMEDMHRHYKDDVIPCVSTGANRAKMVQLVRWLLEMLTDGSHGAYPDYPLQHDSSDGQPVCLFETLDVVLNGASLAAAVLEGGYFDESPHLIGLVACRIYATIFEYVPATVGALRRRCDERHTDAQVHECGVRIVQYCDANFRIRPVWLHLQYIYLKLKYEQDARVAVFATERLLRDAVELLCEYYTFAVCPPVDFTIWSVAQYSMARALAQLLHVDVEWLVANARIDVLHMPYFQQIHDHYQSATSTDDSKRVV